MGLSMVLRNVKMEVDHNEAAGSAAASPCPFAVLKNDHEDVGSTGGAHVKEEKMEAEQAEEAEGIKMEGTTACPVQMDLIQETFVRRSASAAVFKTGVGTYARRALKPETYFVLYGSDSAPADSALVHAGVQMLGAVEGNQDPWSVRAWSAGRLAPPGSPARRAYRINCVDPPGTTITYPKGMPQVEIDAIEAAAAPYRREPNVRFVLGPYEHPRYCAVLPVVLVLRPIAKGEQLLSENYLFEEFE